MPKGKRRLVVCDDQTWARFILYGWEHECAGGVWKSRPTFAATLRHLLDTAEGSRRRPLWGGTEQAERSTTDDNRNS